ncbi:hypothetical protein ZHAS_00021629 [Anopheles sinensis]|uniref:Uncharacterized protein n=1 Tax=Anopheles sinensis TaxID=74873 RepID=A0A084WSU5_ANOSI|nr:hypothetical protein ZHAS_00021629 [Anopheles sinensis]
MAAIFISSGKIACGLASPINTRVEGVQGIGSSRWPDALRPSEQIKRIKRAAADGDKTFPLGKGHGMPGLLRPASSKRLLVVDA